VERGGDTIVEPFQRLLRQLGKLLKQFDIAVASFHRAKAAVLMKGQAGL
jgi:hypothetical protein